MIIGVALAALVATTFAFGGFEQRRTPYQLVPAGTVMPVGPFEYTFTEVTVQRRMMLDDVEWQAVAIGTGRVVGQAETQPGYLAKNILLVDNTQDVFAEGMIPVVGSTTDQSGALNVSEFTPGLAPEEYRVTFELPASYRPTGYIRLAAAQLTYDDHTYLKTGEKSWGPNGTGFVTWLPVTILPHG